jgi:hypothetical protein
MSSNTRSSLFFLGVVSVMSLALSSNEAVADGLGKRGENLFDGSIQLTGRLHGGDQLNPSDSRCSNCHLPSSSPFNSGKLQQPRGGEIRGAHLLQLTSRRGGPPFRYDLSSFCNLLRNGVDPIDVFVPALMPRYEISNDDCLALWTYLGDTP